MRRANRSRAHKPSTTRGDSRANPPRDLAILTAIADHRCLTQRQIAADVGIAVSLANHCLQRLAREGLIQITRVRTNRLRYQLTAEGLGRQAYLLHDQLGACLTHYRKAREMLWEGLRPLAENGAKRIAFFGGGAAAELSYLYLREHDLEFAGFFEVGGTGSCFGHPLRPVEELPGAEFDWVVVTAWDSQDATAERVEALVHLGVPRARILTLSLRAGGAPEPGRTVDAKAGRLEAGGPGAAPLA